MRSIQDDAFVYPLESAWPIDIGKPFLDRLGAYVNPRLADRQQGKGGIRPLMGAGQPGK